MSPLKFRLKVSFAWWWKPYEYGLLATCFLTGRTPDMDKVQRVIRRAMRVEVIKITEV